MTNILNNVVLEILSQRFYSYEIPLNFQVSSYRLHQYLYYLSPIDWQAGGGFRGQVSNSAEEESNQEKEINAEVIAFCLDVDLI